VDSITQIALGATIGEAGWRRRLGGRAVVWGGFCGLVPDLDIALGAFDPWADLQYHRSFSHSLLLLPLAALAFGKLGHLFGKRRGDWRAWAHLSFWALITHPLLDLFTSYGTQLLWPLSDRRYAWDGVSIIDPVYTLPLFVVLGLALKRTQPPPRWRTRFAAGVLALTTAYLALGTWSMTRARDRARASLRAEGLGGARLRALPTFFNNQSFRLVAEVEEGDFRIGYLSLLAPAPIEWVVVRSAEGPDIDAALASERGRLFEWFSDGYLLARRGDAPDVVELVDLRFGTVLSPTASVFGARVELEGGEVRRVKRLGRPEMDVGAELDALGALLFDGRVQRPRSP